MLGIVYVICYIHQIKLTHVKLHPKLLKNQGAVSNHLPTSLGSHARHDTITAVTMSTLFLFYFAWFSFDQKSAESHYFRCILYFVRVRVPICFDMRVTRAVSSHDTWHYPLYFLHIIERGIFLSKLFIMVMVVTTNIALRCQYYFQNVYTQSRLSTFAFQTFPAGLTKLFIKFNITS